MLLQTRSFVRYPRNDTNEFPSRRPFDSSFFVSQHSYYSAGEATLVALERQRTLELERWLDCEFGERVRRVFYFHALNHRDLAIPLFNQGGPWWGRLFCRVGFRMIVNRIRKMYAITPENVALDMDRVTAAYERLDTLLENRRYLVGDRFSRADLTLAAIALKCGC